MPVGALHLRLRHEFGDGERVAGRQAQPPEGGGEEAADLRGREAGFRHRTFSA